MNVKLNLEELELIVEALNQKHDALGSGGAKVFPELQAVNKLYNRLRELREEHERNHVVLRGLLFSLNSVLKPRMLSVRADYVFSSLHLYVYTVKTILGHT